MLSQVGLCEPHIIEENFRELDGPTLYNRHLRGVNVLDFDYIILKDITSPASIEILLGESITCFSIKNLQDISLLADVFIQFCAMGFYNVYVEEGVYNTVELIQGHLSINTEASGIIIQFASWLLEKRGSLKELNICRLLDEGLIEYLAYILRNSSVQIEEVILSDVREISYLCDALCGRRGIDKFCLLDCAWCDYEPVFQLLQKTNIRELTIKGGGLGDPELASLVACLTRNRTVEVLDLSSNCIGDEGAKMLADLLDVNSTIKYLSLQGPISDIDEGGNYIGDDGANALIKVIRKGCGLKILNLRGLSNISRKQKELMEILQRRRIIRTNILFDKSKADEPKTSERKDEALKIQKAGTKKQKVEGPEVKETKVEPSEVEESKKRHVTFKLPDGRIVEAGTDPDESELPNKRRRTEKSRY